MQKSNRVRKPEVSGSLNGDIAEVKREIITAKPVLYPPVVIAHITNDVTDLFASRMAGKSVTQLHYSAQMNSYPHLGTMLSMMTAFALGRRLSDRFVVPVEFKFEILENVSRDKITKNGLTYTRMLCDTLRDGTPLTNTYLKSFTHLLTMLSERSGIKYTLLTYHEFQALMFVRSTLLEILRREGEFRSVIAPSDNHLTIRIPCKTCGFEDSEGITTKVVETKDDHLILENECFQHGKQRIILAPDNKDFVDMDTPLRNVIKEALFVREARLGNALDLMVDGGDWVAMADFIVSEGLCRLGVNYADRPARLFTPIIEDWSGAKFSKSVHVQHGDYAYLPESFLNLVKFEEEFGQRGIDKLWEEAVSWVSDPKRLFRNYTAEYILQILRS